MNGDWSLLILNDSKHISNSSIDAWSELLLIIFVYEILYVLNYMGFEDGYLS
jgi:hypothetical protein